VVGWHRGDRARGNMWRLNAMTTKDDDGFKKNRRLRRRFEPLREELRPYLEEYKDEFYIRHPFCNDSVHDLDHCALIHRTIDRRTARADACFEAHDYEGYIRCVEIFSQPEWLAKDAELLPDNNYWLLLRGVYENQKYTHYSREVFDKLFRRDRPGRENLMTPEERDVLARLPDVLTVYRGYSDDDGDGYADGISWTLDRRYAVVHANSNLDHAYPRVITGRVRKEDVWAYVGDGNLLMPNEAVYNRRGRAAWSDKARQGWSRFIKKPFDVRRLFKN
jgi:hypothetical protein